jgi:hypothetical protein
MLLKYKLRLVALFEFLGDPENYLTMVNTARECSHSGLTMLSDSDMEAGIKLAYESETQCSDCDETFSEKVSTCCSHRKI